MVLEAGEGVAPNLTCAEVTIIYLESEVKMYSFDVVGQFGCSRPYSDVEKLSRI